jgi:hypothetical protein
MVKYAAMLNEVVKSYRDDVASDIMTFLVSAGFATSIFCLDQSSVAIRKMDWLWWNSGIAPYIMTPVPF